MHVSTLLLQRNCTIMQHVENQRFTKHGLRGCNLLPFMLQNTANRKPKDRVPAKDSKLKTFHHI